MKLQQMQLELRHRLDDLEESEQQIANREHLAQERLADAHRLLEQANAQDKANVDLQKRLA